METAIGQIRILMSQICKRGRRLRKFRRAPRGGRLEIDHTRYVMSHQIHPQGYLYPLLVQIQQAALQIQLPAKSLHGALAQ